MYNVHAYYDVIDDSEHNFLEIALSSMIYEIHEVCYNWRHNWRLFVEDKWSYYILYWYHKLWNTLFWFVLLVFYVTCTLFQSYMWRHRCAGGLKEKFYLRSGSQRHRHFAGFFNVPVLHQHGTTLFIRWIQHTAPFSRLLRHAGDTEYVFST